MYRTPNCYGCSILHVLLFLVCGSELWLCNGITDDQLYDIDLIIEETMKCRQIPGLSLTLVTDDDIVSRGYGLADVKDKLIADESTLFCLGSVGKAFTATLMAMIIDQHTNLTWDTKVKDILPNFQLGDDLRTNETTLRDLLAHRTGLQSGDLAFHTGGGVNRTSLISLLKFLGEETQFRSKFVYNNLMYALLGHIAEYIQGEDFETMITEKLFKPLNMSSAVFVKNLKEHLHKLAKPYSLTNKKFQEIDLRALEVVAEFPSTGGACVSAEDMGQWLRFLLSGGRDMFGNYQVKERLLRETMTEQMVLNGALFSQKLKPRFPVVEISTAYGMGWVVSNYRGYSRVYHSGSLMSYTSQAWLFPNENVAGYISINGPVGSGASRAMETITAYLSDVLLGIQPWLNTITICSYPKPWEVYSELFYNISDIIHKVSNTLPVEFYTGVYFNPLYGRAVVRRANSKDSKLEMVIGNLFKARLHPVDSTNHFLATQEGVFKYLTYSDDRQHIGSVFFNVADNSNGTVFSSLVVEFLDVREYVFHRDEGYYNQVSDVAKVASNVTACLESNIMYLLILSIYLQLTYFNVYDM